MRPTYYVYYRIRYSQRYDIASFMFNVNPIDAYYNNLDAIGSTAQIVLECVRPWSGQHIMLNGTRNSYQMNI